MSEEIFKRFLERAEIYLHDAETIIDLARDEINTLEETIHVSDEVADFLQSLMDNPQIPNKIQDKAGELWTKI